ncbi:DHA2 family efflux MFS transporter permease subunit [Paenibacillus pinisoli]|uniref:DHA2 family efflux MFS transporter permease subunit n=1 Tax=Paenibacillus pinisoli TaxID=1276110 RepID=A0A3A6PJM0_9BACL|nr:DHA2 family efflux MFS transporter permease subunit [Paenibacillus pinisoli]RJX41557.1 DHA2 family efflux MFS transporter permease subunit [Paenibacillus pinisoli]
MEASIQTNAPKQASTTPILISLLLGCFIGMFSETALNIALPELMKQLQVGPTTIQWLTTGYMLVLGIMGPVSGLLLQWFSTRQLFIASLSLSTLGSLIAGLAPSFEVLLAARIFQASGTALLMPLMLNAILILFPPERRGAAMGLMGLVLTFAPASGPTIAGLIIEKLSWHWIFWISSSILFVSLLIGIIFLKNISELTRPKIDLLSIVLSTIGFGSLLFGFSKAGEIGWDNILVISFFIVGVLGLILFTWRQFRIESPLMNLRVFRYRMFSLSVVLFVVVMMLLLSSMLLLPMLLQSGLGKNPLQAGLLLLPGTLISGVLAPFMGKLFDKYGPRKLIIPGLILVGIIMFLFSTISLSSSTMFVIVLDCVLMIALSMVMMPGQTNGMNQLPAEAYPHGTAIMSTLTQVAGAIGSALAMTMLSMGQTSFLRDKGFDMSGGLNLGQVDPAMIEHLPASFVFGIKGAFIFAGAMTIIALFISFFMKHVKSSESNKSMMH